MASNALTWTVKWRAREVDWPTIVRRAIRANAISYLNPPIKNFGVPGIRKAAALAPSWGEIIDDAPAQLAKMALLIEGGGTGGGLFRRMYRDFLSEANIHLKSDLIDEARELVDQSSNGWTEASALLDHFKSDQTSLDSVAEIFSRNADLEEQAFGLLSQL